MVGLIVCGAICLIGGALAVIYGIQIKEFTFGGTLITAGATVASAGALLIGAAVVVRELKAMRRLLEAGGTSAGASAALPMSERPAANPEPILPDPPNVSMRDRGRSGPLDLSSSGDQTQDEANDRREPRADAPAPPPARSRRNLMYTSTSRKERERAASRTGEGEDGGASRTASGSLLSEAPPVTFDEGWSATSARRERAATPPPAPPPPPSLPPSASELPSPASERTEASAAQVSVLKSGVVDGMGYSLYSDGSIEAQLPEGMMRFASIDELRAYLDART